MTNLICLLFDHKYSEKRGKTLFVSNVCLRCFRPSKTALLRYESQKVYFSNGADTPKKWKPGKYVQILDQTKEFNRAMDSHKLDLKPRAIK